MNGGTAISWRLLYSEFISEGQQRSFLNSNFMYTIIFMSLWVGIGSSYTASKKFWNGVTEIAKKEFGESVPYGAYLAIKTAQNNVLPWVTSQADILADDWLVLD